MIPNTDNKPFRLPHPANAMVLSERLYACPDLLELDGHAQLIPRLLQTPDRSLPEISFVGIPLGILETLIRFNNADIQGPAVEGTKLSQKQIAHLLPRVTSIIVTTYLEQLPFQWIMTNIIHNVKNLTKLIEGGYMPPLMSYLRIYKTTLTALITNNLSKFCKTCQPNLQSLTFSTQCTEFNACNLNHLNAIVRAHQMSKGFFDKYDECEKQTQEARENIRKYFPVQFINDMGENYLKVSDLVLEYIF